MKGLICSGVFPHGNRGVDVIASTETAERASVHTPPPGLNHVVGRAAVDLSLNAPCTCEKTCF